MTITNETRATWEPLRERSDVKKLRAITGLGRTAIYDIYKNGECEITVAAQFMKFYEEKAALKKTIEQDQD